MKSERRRWLSSTAMLVVIMALALLLAACEGQVDEEASGTVIGKIDEMSSGESASATFDLSPGKYVLICNISGHYKSGMYTAFEVTGEDGSSATVGVRLGEWFVRSDSVSQEAGSITFEVGNQGESDHNLVIIKTDLAPNALVVS